MRVLDKFEQLVWDSPLAAIILGNPTLTDLALIAPEPLSEEAHAALQARGMGFIGVTGLGTDGKFRSELAVEVDDATVSAIAQAFVQYVLGKFPADAIAAKVAKMSTGDGAAWLADLWKLADTREN